MFADPAPLQAGLERYASAYAAADRDNTARKLGLSDCRDADVELIRELHGLLHAHEADMTLWFRALAELDADAPSLHVFADAFYDGAKHDAGEGAFNDWLARYAVRLREDALSIEQRRARMHAANPKFVLRNWLAQEAIDRAHVGDFAGIGQLLDVMRRPYDAQPGNEHFAGKRPDWAKDRAGCSMLSCSS